MVIDVKEVTTKALIAIITVVVTALAGVIVQTHENQIAIDKHEKRLEKHASYLEEYVLRFVRLEEEVKDHHE